VRAALQPDLFQQLTRALAPGLMRDSGRQQRGLDVALRAEVGQQQVVLEYEPHEGAAELHGGTGIGHRRPVNRNRSGVRSIEASDQVEQRALAGARGTGDRDELAGRHLERDPPQRLDRPIRLDHGVDLDRRSAFGCGSTAVGPRRRASPGAPELAQDVHGRTVTGHPSVADPALVRSTASKMSG